LNNESSGQGCSRYRSYPCHSKQTHDQSVVDVGADLFGGNTTRIVVSTTWVATALSVDPLHNRMSRRIPVQDGAIPICANESETTQLGKLVYNVAS